MRAEGAPWQTHVRTRNWEHVSRNRAEICRETQPNMNSSDTDATRRMSITNAETNGGIRFLFLYDSFDILRIIGIQWKQVENCNNS